MLVGRGLGRSSEAVERAAAARGEVAARVRRRGGRERIRDAARERQDRRDNAVAREFSAYPGLFPTVGTKLVKRGPFSSKRAMYAALDSDVERAALRKYDAAIVLNARDSAVMQYKGSQICKYECGRGKGGGYRDEQIRQVQTNRR